MRDIPYFMIFFPLNHFLVELFTPSSGVCGLGGLLLAGTLKSEGVTALFKGASMRMAVQAPMFAIMTTAFELQKRYIASK